MLEDRKMMMRLFPEVFAKQRIAPVDHYPNLLLKTLKSSSRLDNPNVVVLTPGASTAPFSNMRSWPGNGRGTGGRRRPVRARPQGLHAHHRWAQSRGRDLPPDRRRVPRPAGVQPDSMLGVPGLVAAYRAGNVVLANAIGTGVADDKSIYPYVPK
jgi:uncharacterized circularly permuted ATP-grasp superfamily protein